MSVIVESKGNNVPNGMCGRHSSSPRGGNETTQYCRSSLTRAYLRLLMGTVTVLLAVYTSNLSEHAFGASAVQLFPFGAPRGDTSFPLGEGEYYTYTCKYPGGGMGHVYDHSGIHRNGSMTNINNPSGLTPNNAGKYETKYCALDEECVGRTLVRNFDDLCKKPVVPPSGKCHCSNPGVEWKNKNLMQKNNSLKCIPTGKEAIPQNLEYSFCKSNVVCGTTVPDGAFYEFDYGTEGCGGQSGGPTTKKTTTTTTTTPKSSGRFTSLDVCSFEDFFAYEDGPCIKGCAVLITGTKRQYYCLHDLTPDQCHKQPDSAQAFYCNAYGNVEPWPPVEDNTRSQP